MCQQMRVDLGHRVHGHRNHDQQAGAAEVERQRLLRDQELRQQTDQRQVERARQRDPREPPWVEEFRNEFKAIRDKSAGDANGQVELNAKLLADLQKTLAEQAKKKHDQWVQETADTKEENKKQADSNRNENTRKYEGSRRDAFTEFCEAEDYHEESTKEQGSAKEID